MDEQPSRAVIGRVDAAPFVLDRAENPHPRLLALAVKARRSARRFPNDMAHQSYYLGVLHACVEATGCADHEVVGWLDHHEAEVE